MFIRNESYGQCKVKVVVPRTNTCLGDTISMYALGGCGSLLVEHFNDSSLGNQLTSNKPITIDRACGSGSDGSPYLWFGNLSSGPHTLTTNGFNFSNGSFQVCFDMRYGEEGSGGDCEGPSSLSEAVHLQYSTNNGVTWTDIQVWDPAGGHQPNLINWDNYIITVPTAALTSNTMIRWAQLSTSPLNSANWGIDNINIRSVISSNYFWSTSYSGIQHPDIHPSNPTSYTVTASGANGCSCSDSLTIYPHPKPNASYTYTTPLCKNQDIFFNYNGTTSPSANYKWSFPNANTVSGSGQGPIKVQWSKTGSYYPQLVVSENGCSSEIFKKEVRVSPLISFFIDKTSGCEPLTIQYTGNAYPDSSSYFWDFGDGGSSTDSTPVYTYINAGEYDLSIIVVTDSGCIDTLILNKFTRVFASPNVDFSHTPPVIPFSNPEASFSNETINGQLFYWDFGDGGSSSQENPKHTYSMLGDYLVWLTVENTNGCIDSASKIIKVAENRFSTPNVITPNNDGINDYFKVKNLESLQSCSIEIYNRWGQIVYSNPSYDNKWDGEQYADGVYFYRVKYVSYFDEGEFYGSLTIIRQ